MLAGAAAKIDITPEPGLMMSGFIARTKAACGSHDPLTVRAVVINDTALVVCDVIGMHEDMSQRIRHNAPLPADNIIIAALHNHGAPASMAGRLSETASTSFLARLETACVDAIALAQQRLKPCYLRAGYARPPGIAVNRRHSDGLVDDALPVLTVVNEYHETVASIVSYACHPVVLGADNLLYTADYPHYVRESLELQYPGSIAVFVTGAAGDANSGHSAKDSLSTAANQQRTFAEAQRIGEIIAHNAKNAELTNLDAISKAANSSTSLMFARRETVPPGELSVAWRGELNNAEDIQKILLERWIYWAEYIAPSPLSSWRARVSVLSWGAALIVALPGEIFAATAHRIRELIREFGMPDRPVFIVAYAEGNPGYIPPSDEFEFGGYEIDEAHRYYGMAATFAADSVERLLGAVKDCLEQQL